MKVLAHTGARGSLILLLALIATACASQDARIAKAQKHTDQAIAALAQMTDADSLAAAGLLSIGEKHDLSLAFLARATDAAPDRADLYWLRAMRCSELPPCDPIPIEQRLRELDPMNGAGWWSAMTRAGTTHDSQGTNAALTAISHSERVDIYWTTLIAHLSPAVAKTNKMSLYESEVTIIGQLAAEEVPPYQYVSASCKGDHLQQPGVTETCRSIAKAFQRGDTYLTEIMGVAIAKRVWPEESPEWKAAAEQRRVYDYRSKLYVKLESRTFTHPREYLALCAQNRRESDLFAAQLIAAGYDPNPPGK
jgi:hypothetical protein